MKLIYVLLVPSVVTGVRLQTEIFYARGTRADPQCQVDHTADMKKPMEQVIRENPGADMNCYFEKAGELNAAKPGHDPGLRFWVHPVIGTPDYTWAWQGAESMKQDPMTCPGGWHGDGSGPLVTSYYEGGPISTHQDCGYYTYDDFYFYALGWLRGQDRLNGSLLSNARAWEEQAAVECEKIRQEIQPKPEETSLLFNAIQNGVINSKSNCALSESCKTPVTTREFKLHVYTKCLMGGKRTAAGEMAYGYSRACLLPGGKMIGHGVECEGWVPALI